MSTPQFRLAGAAAAALGLVSLALLTSCAKSGAEAKDAPAVEPRRPVPQLATVDQTDVGAPADGSQGTADALTRKANSYAQHLEQVLAEREAAAAAAAAAAAGVAPLANGGAEGSMPVARAPRGGMPVAPPASSGLVAPNGVAPARPNAPASNEPAPSARVANAKTPPQPPKEGAANQPDEIETVGTRLDDPASPVLRTVATDPLERKMAQRIKDDPRDVGAHLDYQLLQFLQDETAPDLTSLAPLPEDDRELLSALLDGLSNFRGTARSDPNALMSEKVRPVIEMAERLRAQSDLSIARVALCTKVDQFGVYTPIEPARFTAGKEHELIIYCELANFASHLTDARMWQTKLSYEAGLYTENEAGLQIDTRKASAIVDNCRSRRTDFFLADRVKLPAQLPIGRYLYKVTVIDEHAHRIAEASIPLQIVISTK